MIIDLPHPLIAIVGPTASGKTALAIALAKHYRNQNIPCEIINADTYQMYRSMDIGTAKPTKEEQASITHHCIDIVQPHDVVTVAEFQHIARTHIRDCAYRGVLPIIVGGSGLYARAAIDDITFQGTDPAVRAALEQEADVLGAMAMFERLQSLDPQAAATMDYHNIRRTIRALEVIEITGRPYSASLPKYQYVIPTVQIGLDLNRDILDERIAMRTEQMKKHGIVEEVRALQNSLSVTASRALGYPEVMAMLRGELSEDETFALIAQRTRRLARKQMGWFGRDPRIHWFDAMRDDLVEAVAQCVADPNVIRQAYCNDSNADDRPVQHHLGAIAM